MTKNAKQGPGWPSTQRSDPPTVAADCAAAGRRRTFQPMPRNIEIKARIESVEALAVRAATLADGGPTEIAQDDTFFTCDAGRLKLRQFADGTGELIFYQRADQQGPKESFFLIARTEDPDALRSVLSHACGEAGRVVKHRTLYLAGRTRIHLDRVAELGDFLELEVVLEDGEPSESGVRTAHEVMDRLGVARAQLLDGAYVDLLSQPEMRRAR